MSLSPELAALARAAARLPARSAMANGLSPPALLVLSDPVRTPDPLALAERLPAGTGLVYRAFGAADAHPVALALAAAARRRGLVLLVGADAALARACGAAGVHLPERAMGEATRLRARHPGWLLTAAAHGRPALARARALGLDAALLSVAFPSQSPSTAGRAPLGPVRLAALARAAAPLPVYALGGVTAATAPRLADAGVAGLAVVGAAGEGRAIIAASVHLAGRKRPMQSGRVRGDPPGSLTL